MSADRVTLDLGGIPVRALLEYLRGTGDQDISGEELDAVALQIEAQTKPPRPTEPTGLGAVVEDAEGVRWVRAERVALAYMHWRSDTDKPMCAKWKGFDAVRVLSEGVTA